MNAVKSTAPCTIRFADAAKFKAFVTGLQPSDQELVTSAIQKILKLDGKSLLNEGWLKDLGGDLFEFRVGPTRRKVHRRSHQKPENFFDTDLLVRIFCTFVSETEIIILHFYDKTSDRSRSTQKAEIAKARELLLNTRSSLEF
jgi:hypothetical protein